MASPVEQLVDQKTFSLGRQPRIRVPRRQRLPVAVENRYVDELKQILNVAKKAVDDLLVPRLGEIGRAAGVVDSASIGVASVVDEDWSAALKSIFGDIRSRMAAAGINEQEIAETIASDTSIKNRIEVGRQLRGILGVDIFADDSKAQDDLRAFVVENVDLIKSVPEQYLSQVEQVVSREFRAGKRASEISAQLQARYGVAKSRADLIGRDQVLKLNGNLTRDRQKAIGITEYIWRTSRDERVRKSHARLEGTVQSWDEPPLVAKGRREHPGGDYQCRCTPEPIIPKAINTNVEQTKTKPKPKPKPKPKKKKKVAPLPPAPLPKPKPKKGRPKTDPLPESLPVSYDDDTALAVKKFDLDELNDLVDQLTAAYDAGEPLPKEVQAEIRRQINALYREFGMVNRTVVGDLPKRLLLDIEAISDHGYNEFWNGRIVISDGALESLRSEDPVEFAGALHTLIHEGGHSHSPIARGSYEGIAAKVEEATTEFIARRLTRRVLDDDAFRKSYTGYTKAVEDALIDALDDAGIMDPIDVGRKIDPNEIIELASIEFKRTVGLIKGDHDMVTRLADSIVEIITDKNATARRFAELPVFPDDVKLSKDMIESLRAMLVKQLEDKLAEADIWL